jgi:hypothetical protein
MKISTRRKGEESGRHKYDKQKELMKCEKKTEQEKE